MFWWKPRPLPEKAEVQSKHTAIRVAARLCITPLKSWSSSHNNEILRFSTLLAEGLVYRAIYDLIPDDSKSHRHLTPLNCYLLALPDPWDLSPGTILLQ